MKLSAVRDVIQGNRMVVCEDSIVRGTQLKNYTIRKLWDNGAKEIQPARPARRSCFPAGTPLLPEPSMNWQPIGRFVRCEEGKERSRSTWISNRKNTPTWSNGSAVIWM